MADLDLARVKRNVAKMAAQNAPEADIDGYIASEGTTVDAVRAFRPEAASPSAASPDDPKSFGGTVLNATAGLNSGLYGVAGAPVDFVRGAMNLGIRGYNAATGSDVAPIPENSFGGSRYIAETLGGISPVLDPRNTAANSIGEKIVRGAGEGAGYAIAPEALVAGLSRAGTLTGRGAETVGKLFGKGESFAGTAGNVTAGAAGGAGSQAAMEATDDTYDPLSGTLGGIAGSAVATLAQGIPGLVRTGGRMVGDYLAPATNAGRERIAAERLQSSASDLTRARETLDNMPAERVPGSVPTTGQVTGDMGLLAAERGAAVKAPEQFGQRRADQNAARVNALEGVQTGGAPEKVADAFRTRLQQIEADEDNAFAAASKVARTSAAAVGPGMAPDAVGERLRASLEAARAQAKDRERQLWSAVDPDGKMTIGLSNTRQSVGGITKELSPLAQPLSPTESQIYGAIGQAGEMVPLRAMQDLQSNLKAAMRAERSTNGETPAYRRMSIVSAGIAKDFEDAVAGRVAQEAQAVQRGEMRLEDTVEARWAREIEAWRDRREAATGGDGSPAPRGYAGGRTAGVSGVYGTEGQAVRQSGGPTGSPSLSPNAGGASFDRAAFDRLSAANAATRERAETFDNRVLAPMRQRPTATGPYNMPAAAVPERVFFPGAKSAEAIGQFRRAVGDAEALPALEGYAVDRLRRTALRDDGTFDPGKLDSWRRTHADALRAFPELNARLADAGRAAETMGDVVRRQRQRVADAQKGALGRLVQIDSPEDVTRIVGGIFSAQDANRRMTELRRAIGNDKQAQNGLRQAVVDHIRAKFISNTEAGTSGIGTMKSDGFQTFVRQNRSALRGAGFSDDELGVMQAIADDLQQANRSIAAVKNPGGSDTAQNFYSAAGKPDKATVFSRLLANLPAAVGGVGGFAVGGPITAIMGAAGAKTIADFRLAGIQSVDDMVTDALLNPNRARILLNRPTTRANEAATLKMLGQSYRSAATASVAMSLNGEDSRASRKGDDPEARRLKAMMNAVQNPRPAPRGEGFQRILGVAPGAPNVPANPLLANPITR